MRLEILTSFSPVGTSLSAKEQSNEQLKKKSRSGNQGGKTPGGLSSKS